KAGTVSTFDPLPPRDDDSAHQTSRPSSWMVVQGPERDWLASVADSGSRFRRKRERSLASQTAWPARQSAAFPWSFGKAAFAAVSLPGLRAGRTGCSRSLLGEDRGPPSARGLRDAVTVSHDPGSGV